MLTLKLYKDKISKDTNLTLYIEIETNEIVDITLNGVMGKANGKPFYLCYFAFFLNDGRRFNVDFNEAHKFKDLINKYNLEKEYNEYKNFIENIDKEIEK